MLGRSTCRLISTNVNFTFNVTTSHNNRFFTNLDPISFPAKIRADRNMIINQEYRAIHRHHRGQMANANVINGNHNRTTFVVEQYGPPTNRIPNQFNWKGVTVSPYAFPIIPIVKLDLHYPKIKYINGKRTRCTHPHTQPRPFPAITLSLYHRYVYSNWTRRGCTRKSRCNFLSIRVSAQFPNSSQLGRGDLDRGGEGGVSTHNSCHPHNPVPSSRRGNSRRGFGAEGRGGATAANFRSNLATIVVSRRRT